MFRRLVGSHSLPALAIAGTSFINRMAGTAKLFMALYLREALGLDLATVGVLLSLYGAGMFSGSYLFGTLTDHYPARRLLAATLIGSAVGLLALCWVTTPVGVGLWLLAGGLCDGGFRPAMQRVLMESCPPLERTQAQALQRVAVNLGFALGGIVGGVFASHDYRLVFVADAASSLLAAGFLAYVLARAPEVAPTLNVGHEGAMRWPYRDAPFLLFLLACLLLSTVYAQSESTMTNYLREY